MGIVSREMSKHYHFIGIGGIGMGTLATLMLTKNFKISGSDAKENQITKSLKELGATIFIGHQAKHVEGADYVVFSSAIRADNPEIQAARAKHIPILKRAQLLAWLMNPQVGVTIAGAHGKTTTTSMVSNLLIKAGFKPTTAIGGISHGVPSYNANLGDGKYFVAEVDESDGSFLYFTPKYSIITNIDFEHVDYYHNWENILKAYRQFIQRTAADGWVIVCGDDERLHTLMQGMDKPCVTYGVSSQNTVYAQNIQCDGFSSHFDCVIDGKNQGQFTLNVPGQHNVLNALACISLGWKLNIDFDVIRQSLQEYRGVQRRLQVIGEVDNILIMDDYGHHPTEIKATLSAAKHLRRKRLVTAFQPHRYTRTKFSFNEFAGSLSLSDYLIVTDIYAASEPPIEGVTAQKLVEKIKENFSGTVIYLKKDEIVDHLANIASAGDLVLTLGAGDITYLGQELVNKLKDKKSAGGSLKHKSLFS